MIAAAVLALIALLLLRPVVREAVARIETGLVLTAGPPPNEVHR